MHRTFIVVFAAPVPLGHRVELTWYEEVQRGLVPSQVRVDWRPHQPVIRDLDTGVEYATDWGFGHGGRSGPDQPERIAAQPLPDFRVRDRVVGVVRACRVVTVLARAHGELQTHLAVEVEA